MKDIAGDRIDVDAYPGEYVSLLTEAAVSALTPKKARKLAQKLEMAAAVVDGTAARDLGGYWLSLTEDQAKTLAVILGRIGGPTGFAGSDVTARKYAEEIREQLGVDGLDVERDDPRFTVDDVREAIYFVGVAE